MYKSRLHELCQRHKLPSPSYATEWDGPDHNLRFKGLVTIGEMSFSGNDLCKSVKDAHNDASKVALDHFIPQLPPRAKVALLGAEVKRDAAMGVEGFGSLNERFVLSSEQSKTDEATKLFSIPTVAETETRDALGFPNSMLISSLEESQETKTKDVLLDFAFSYKSQLQNYTQKRNLDMPSYSSVQEGSSRPPRFKATVIVNGKSFEGQVFANSIKGAENEAAKYALSFVPEEPNEEDIHLYKNILQKLVQKEMHTPRPIYKTVMDGPLHIPAFVSTVEIEGQWFVGKYAKTKKQAEQNAAKVACNIFKEWNRIPSSTEPLCVICGENKEAGDLSPNPIRSTPEILTSDKNINTNHPHDASSMETEHQAAASEKIEIQHTQTHVKSCSSSSEEKISQKSSSSMHDYLQTIANEDFPHRSNRVVILPHKPDMAVPEGATVLPFDDDSWVVIGFNSSNQKQTSS